MRRRLSKPNERISISDINIKEVLSGLNAWFQDNGVGERTIKDRINYAKRFLSWAKELSIDEAKRFLFGFNNPNTYNNTLQALRFLFRFMDFPELPFKQKDNRPTGLIIPKNGNVRTKNYRPNPLHPIIAKFLQRLDILKLRKRDTLLEIGH